MLTISLISVDENILFFASFTATEIKSRAINEAMSLVGGVQYNGPR